MKFPNAIFAILRKPFPEQEGSFGDLKTNGVVSAFVVFFLYVFEPFGLSTLQSEKFVICLSFGAITFLATAFFEFIMGRIFKAIKIGSWTFGKWILYMLGIILTISLANFLFARLVFFGFIEWRLFPQMIYSTLMIGIIPLIIIGGISLNIKEKKYKSIAAQINLQKEFISVDNSADNRSLFDIPVHQIKYIEALQNYVHIAYLDPDGQLKKVTERATLKQILEETSGSSIIKAHRSFLVNQKAIVSISGNAQGLLLELSDSDRKIPVSRSYVPIFRG